LKEKRRHDSTHISLTSGNRSRYLKNYISSASYRSTNHLR